MTAPGGTTAIRLAHPLVGTAVVDVLVNAIANTGDEGTVEVAARVDEGADVIEIDVTDTGDGLPELERRALEDATEGPLSHGQGVGLWLTKWVVEASDGELRFEEHDPHGTVVHLRLPRADDPPTAPA